MNRNLEVDHECNGKATALSTTGILPQLQQFLLIENQAAQSKQALQHIPGLIIGTISWSLES